MTRAIQLAQMATKAVGTNPKVGAVLVYNHRIIGEGYHHKYGEGHAEVNCIHAVSPEDQDKISDATIYVTLEPCHHYGKTPPCVELIIKHNIKHVVLGTIDPNPKVGGQSIAKLTALGINVVVGVCEDACKSLIAPFVKMMNEKIPWITLKLAKSKYNYMAGHDGQVWLSGPASKLYVHRMRADMDGIMIGTNTALVDNPSLTTRLVDGDHPTRIVLDRHGKIPTTSKIFTDGIPTVIVGASKRSLQTNVSIIPMESSDEGHLKSIMRQLYSRGIYRLMVEGGPSLLKSIIKEDLWDAAVVINTPHELSEGILAPNINGYKIKTKLIGKDKIVVMTRISYNNIN